MKCISTLTTLPSSRAAIAATLDRLASMFGDQPADLVVVFATAHHARELGPLGQEILERTLSRHVLASTAESVAGEDREIEAAPALAAWAVRFPEGARLTPTRIAGQGGETEPPSVDLTALDPRTSALLLVADPFSFPADQWLRACSEAAPGLRVLGGMASGGGHPGVNRLVLDGDVFESGAVGVAIDGPLRIESIVSQGCRPIGRPFVITRAEGNLIQELGRRPALEVFQEIFQQLEPEDQGLVRAGLHLGRVINEYQERFTRGDFLVRNVIGASEDGAIAITDTVRVGQTVQFHVRDAATADEDLRTLLAPHQGTDISAALLFTCNGRGTRLFGKPNHDIAAIHDSLGPIPVAGFFAMGEIGPVGGQNFVHGFTASIALFGDPR